MAIKGPLTTPVGGGIRSLNVTLRQVLDLYACVRPVRYFEGTPAPVRHPENMNVIIFRENTEDVYAGIEWARGTPQALKLIEFLEREMGKRVRPDSGIGIKPISEFGTKRLVRMAIRHAITFGRKSVTLVHKGNIMKFTEGAFRDWGYEVATQEFRDHVVTEDEVWQGASREGKVLINDRIADSVFQQVLTRTKRYDVFATPNLNGDYLSDACAAQVGGLGMAPGANIGDDIAFFEATHGTAPKYAGKDVINPSSVDPVGRDDARLPRMEGGGQPHREGHRAGRSPRRRSPTTWPGRWRGRPSSRPRSSPTPSSATCSPTAAGSRRLAFRHGRRSPGVAADDEGAHS